MTDIYHEHLFPGATSDQDTINSIIANTDLSGISNIRLLSWGPSAVEFVPRIENAVNQLIAAGFGIDVMWDLRNVMPTHSEMETMCSLSKGDTIWIVSWLTYGGWGTPIDFLLEFRDVAKSFGHSFGFMNDGELVYVEPATMLMDTGIYVASGLNPSVLPPRELYKEPYMHNYRTRWAYPLVSARWFLPSLYAQPATSQELIDFVNELKSFLQTDGTINNVKKMSISFEQSGYIVPNPLIAGVNHLVGEFADVGNGVPPPWVLFAILGGGGLGLLLLYLATRK